MIQRKLIAVLGAVALLACTAGVSEASLSRVEGMGLGSVPFLSQFTDDYVNIFPYPTSVVRQNNLVLVELGSNSDGETTFSDGSDSEELSEQSFTLIKNFSNFGAIAFQMEQSDLNSAFPGNLNNQNIDIIWGRGFNGMDLAIRLDMTNSYYEFEDTADNSLDYRGLSFIGSSPYPFGLAFGPNAITATGVELNTWGVTPAIAFHLANDNRIEAALTLRTYNLERSGTAGGVDLESWEDDGNLSYSVLVRGVMNQGDRATWFPAAWYVNDDLSYTVSNLPGGIVDREVDESYRNWGIGISHNMRVNDNNLLIFGAAIGEEKHEFERNDNNDGVLDGQIQSSEDKIMVLPVFFAGLETDATSWLKVRMGATNALTKTEFDETTFAAAGENEKFGFSEFEFHIGAGLRWNNLDVDVTVNEAFPISGGYILSGDEETPFTRASATYHF
ncbi:MAG TPA: hypothetical protein VFP58_08420 [Candidatus Eisenbacteria bacterium]|nr:hypothetical protein [Candidatus Eisenbacteria bacterium]